MEKLKSLLTGGGLLFFVILFGSCGFPCREPEKPIGVPAEAIWSGGCDGGNWIYLVEVKPDKFRFRIFTDYDSTVLMDADFVSSGKCESSAIPPGHKILESIVVVDPDKILVQSKEKEGEVCSLIPQYPAYGGYAWEIIKKNKGL